MHSHNTFDPKQRLKAHELLTLLIPPDSSNSPAARARGALRRHLHDRKLGFCTTCADLGQPALHATFKMGGATSRGGYLTHCLQHWRAVAQKYKRAARAKQKGSAA